jgi:polyvinyl alcohol dehydrogenase (cytochrome)
MKLWNRFAVIVGAIALLAAASARAQQEPGAREPGGAASLEMPADLPGVSGLEGQIVFGRSCASCHVYTGVSAQRAPDIPSLRKLSPETIYAVLNSGTMRAQGQNLTDDQKRSVALYLAGSPVGSSEAGDAKNMSNRCSGDATVKGPLDVASWNGWGAGSANTRYQPASKAGLSADQLPHLKLKWAFGFPGSSSVWGQPTVVAGHLFIGNDTGYVYSLNAKSGCVYWSYKAQAAVRTAITVGPVQGQGTTKYAVYFGDLKANVYAVDASTGKMLWTVHADDHPMVQITGGPALVAGRLYVPVATTEESVSSNDLYPCCSARGIVLALDANTGRQIWKTYTIPETPKPTKKNWNGMQLYAPAGGSVWTTPTVDLKAGAVYVGTGDAYTEPAADTTDAVLALDINTGKIRWSFQGTENDVWLANCGPEAKTLACPEGVLGPDYDFGASAMLRTLPGGRRILVIPQKSGVVWAFDPDRNGALLWKTNLATKRPNPQGAIVFGGAADEQYAYFAITEGGMVALRLKDGKKQWFTPIVAPGMVGVTKGQAAAVTAIPGAAFIGGWDGKLHALSTKDGRILWEFETAREFPTVNGVKAKGGAMGGPGAVVGGGMLYVGSGYASFGTGPGNVLLAFGLD